MIRESERQAPSGLAAIFVLLVLLLLSAYAIREAVRWGSPAMAVAAGIVALAVIFAACGLFVVNPNEGRVLQLFGDYRGTVKDAGPALGQPLLHQAARSRCASATSRASGSRSTTRDGNPIEIAAVVVWRVVDTAEAVFEVDDYENYVKVQSEAAVRNLATRYPYDAHEERRTSRCAGTRPWSPASCKHEIQERLAKAGVEVDRGAHQPPGLRPRDRLGDAAPPAGGRHHRRAPEDRGGRGGHGGDGPRAARQEPAWSSSTRSARRPW